MNEDKFDMDHEYDVNHRYDHLGDLDESNPGEEDTSSREYDTSILNPAPSRRVPAPAMPSRLSGNLPLIPSNEEMIETIMSSLDVLCSLGDVTESKPEPELYFSREKNYPDFEGHWRVAIRFKMPDGSRREASNLWGLDATQRDALIGCLYNVQMELQSKLEALNASLSKVTASIPPEFFSTD